MSVQNSDMTVSGGSWLEDLGTICLGIVPASICGILSVGKGLHSDIKKENILNHGVVSRFHLGTWGRGKNSNNTIPW
jgi:hypothetical protein